MTFSNPSVKKCDRYLQFGWYRFRGSAGTMMPTSCVPTYKCGTDAPGWLQGRHPSTSEGAIQAKVCFHWGSNCCQWSSSIRVRNCGSFYVYQLVGSPECTLRYCGNGAQSKGRSSFYSLMTTWKSGTASFLIMLYFEHGPQKRYAFRQHHPRLA